MVEFDNAMKGIQKELGEGKKKRGEINKYSLHLLYRRRN